jgi:hypothetical protein
MARDLASRTSHLPTLTPRRFACIGQLLLAARCRAAQPGRIIAREFQRATRISAGLGAPQAPATNATTYAACQNRRYGAGRRCASDGQSGRSASRSESWQRPLE